PASPRRHRKARQRLRAPRLARARRAPANDESGDYLCFFFGWGFLGSAAADGASAAGADTDAAGASAEAETVAVGGVAAVVLVDGAGAVVAVVVAGFAVSAAAVGADADGALPGCALSSGQPVAKSEAPARTRNAIGRIMFVTP